MNRHTGIRRQRLIPRRGRVIDEAYLDWADGQPCCITKKFPATSHHVRFCGSPKDDTRIVRLAPELHMHDFGMNSIERLGKEKFEAFHGIKLEAEIVKLRQKYEREMCPIGGSLGHSTLMADPRDLALKSSRRPTLDEVENERTERREDLWNS